MSQRMDDDEILGLSSLGKSFTNTWDVGGSLPFKMAGEAVARLVDEVKWLKAEVERLKSTPCVHDLARDYLNSSCGEDSEEAR